MIVSYESFTTTRLIHRAYSGAKSWWHSAIVCDLPGSFGDTDLQNLAELLPDIKKMGFNSILLRLALADIAPQQAALSSLVGHAHGQDLKVIVRIGAAPEGAVLSPTEHGSRLELDNDADLLVERTRRLVEIGVDGVDLGVIQDAPDEPDSLEKAEIFSQTVAQQMAELVDAESTAILTAEAIRTNTDIYRRHVTEDWFHHLRDDALFNAPWDAQELAARVQETYAIHDPLGQIVAWRPSQGASWEPTPEGSLTLPDAWADWVPEQRFSAMMAFVAALPGALYLPFLQCGGHLGESDPSHPALSLSLGQGPLQRFQFDLARRILGLRAQRNLATGTLAVVEGLEWANPGVSVHVSGHLLVVLNSSEEDVLVPQAHSPLLYSDGFISTTDEATVVRPNTCAWFLPAENETVEPPAEDW